MPPNVRIGTQATDDDDGLAEVRAHPFGNDASDHVVALHLGGTAQAVNFSK